MLVGMAVTSRATNQSVTAQFRGFENITGTPAVMSQTLSKEPLGPSSRRTGLVISEVMYHPRTVGNFTNNSLEFIEIFNSQSYFEDIGNYRLSGAIEYTFPPNTVMQPGTFLVIARDRSFVQSHYGISGVLGPWDGVGNNGISTNGLPGGSGRVRLRNPAGAVLLEVNYQGGSPWPIAADGVGHSLVLARASYGEGDVKAWDASDTIDGSPGRAEPFSSDPLSPVVINEFLAYPDYVNIISLCELELDDVRKTNASVWSPRWTLGTQLDKVREMHAEGRKVFSWTIDDQTFIKKFIQEGEFDGLLSNYSASTSYYFYMQE